MVIRDGQGCFNPWILNLMERQDGLKWKGEVIVIVVLFIAIIFLYFTRIILDISL